MARMEAGYSFYMYMTSSDVCSKVGISRNTLIRYENKGYIEPTFRLENGGKRYTQESISSLVDKLKWLEKKLSKNF